MKNINQNELLYMSHLNDAYAVSKLIQKYSGLMYKEVMDAMNRFPSLAGRKEDLLQEARVCLSQAIDSYRTDQYASFTTFLSIVIKRRLMNESRKTTSSSFIPLYVQYSLDAPVADGMSGELECKNVMGHPEYYLSMHDAYQAIENAVTQLSVAEKDVLYSWMNGDSYKEGTKRCHCANEKKYESHLRKVKKIVHEAIT